MVKIISNVKGDMVSASVELAGDLQVIVSEIGSAISSMYNRIKAQDKSAANDKKPAGQQGHDITLSSE